MQPLKRPISSACKSRKNSARHTTAGPNGGPSLIRSNPRRSLRGAICRRWRTFPRYKTSDGIHISLQIAQSLSPDLSHSVAKSVPSPSRKSRSASTRHASRLRFVSPAYPLLFNRWKQGIRLCFQLLFALQKLAIAAPVLAWADFVNVRVSHSISQQISCGDRFGQFRTDHCLFR